MTSAGFCLLNTVAVATSYARYNYTRDIGGRTDGLIRGLRVAVVDIDEEDSPLPLSVPQWGSSPTSRGWTSEVQPTRSSPRCTCSRQTCSTLALAMMS